MSEDINWSLLAKYFAGECSAEEAARVRAWVEADPAREVVLEELRQVWRTTSDASPWQPSAAPEKSSASEKGGSWDTDRLWERVQEETTQGEPAPTSPRRRAAEDETPMPPAGSPGHTGSSRRAPSKKASSKKASFASRHALRSLARRFSAKQRAAGAAATLAVVAALVALWSLGPAAPAGSEEAAAPEAKTFATEAGQRADIRLTDGSRVRLNVDSRLTVLSKFGEDRRVVRLEGEAFFEVAKDSTRPFIVHAGNATTRVLGTAFDVSAYAEDEVTQVVVKEGSVALHTPKRSVAERSAAERPVSGDSEQTASQEREVVLTKGQKGRLFQSGERVVSKGVGVASYLAWMDGELVFEDASFEEVSRKLERWYGLVIEMKGPTATVPPGHLNARFGEKQPMSEVLGVVATAFGLDYERPKPKRVTFTVTQQPSQIP